MKVLIGIGSILLLLVLVGIGVVSYTINKNNELVDLRETARANLGLVGSALQRRADLLPNVAKVVAKYAKHEKETFVETAQARASAAGGIKLTPELLADPKAMAQFQKVQGDITSFFSRLMVVQEQYPELKADRLFIDLQAQVEGTENRIKVERDGYTKSAQKYNTAILKFPASLVANYRGFKELPYFQEDEGAKKAPDLGNSLQ